MANYEVRGSQLLLLFWRQAAQLRACCQLRLPALPANQAAEDKHAHMRRATHKQRLARLEPQPCTSMCDRTAYSHVPDKHVHGANVQNDSTMIHAVARPRNAQPVFHVFHVIRAEVGPKAALHRAEEPNW